jgi:hypothetical protein
MEIATFGADAGTTLRVRGVAVDERASLRRDEPTTVVIRPQDGVINYDSFVYVLHFDASGAPAASERAAFVSLSLRVDARRPQRAP